MARLLLLFIAGMIFAAHASVIPGDSLSENEMPAEELGEEDFDEREDSDEMPEEGEEVDEGQPQEDTSDAAMTPEGESYSKYNAQKNKLTLESTHKVISSPWYKGEYDGTPPLSSDMLYYFEKIFPSVGSLSTS
ncbi:uncharacterized protein [Porites lutea]|uniref:uncharacterized protein n=1 Tax=Porites lutea TaxID=51062 RepID=UPI003CC5453A